MLLKSINAVYDVVKRLSTLDYGISTINHPLISYAEFLL